MRMMMIVLTAVASVLVTGWAEAGTVSEPGEGFIKHKKLGDLGPDYYVVRKGESGKCAIVTGKPGDKPVGAVGDAPYANKQYATKALKSSPECKGGLAEDTDQ
jgi:hypothetical protein